MMAKNRYRDFFALLLVIAATNTAVATDINFPYGERMWHELVKKGTADVRQAAQDGNARAAILLGLAYAKGFQIKQDYEKAFKWYQRATKRGAVDGLLLIGLAYQHGKGVEQNSQRAIEYFRKAAKYGVTDAYVSLGYLYAEGIGVRQDHETAAKFYSRGARHGDKRAQYNLARLYEEGIGVEKSVEKAVHWYTQSAQQGLVPAQTNLANLYVRRPEKLGRAQQAFYWYGAAALAGDDLAADNLADWLVFGSETSPERIALARALYEHAAKMGNDEALYSLGLLHRDGIAGQKDVVHAASCFDEARRRGNRKAASVLEALLTEFTEAQQIAYRQGMSCLPILEKYEQ